MKNDPGWHNHPRPNEEDPLNKGSVFFYAGRHWGDLEILRKNITPHRHPGLELIGFQRPGTFCFQDREIAMAPNDVAFVDGLIPHEVSTPRLDILVLQMSRAFVIDAHVDRSNLVALRPFALIHTGVAPVVRNAPEIMGHLRKAIEERARATPEGLQMAFAHAILAINLLAQRVEKENANTIVLAESGKKSRLTAVAIDFIHAHYRRDFSIQELADHCRASVSKLAHSFKEQTGTAPGRFINQVRISHCLSEIDSTERKISAIALANGFNNLSQFYRIFKNVTGHKPGEARKKAHR